MIDTNYLESLLKEKNIKNKKELSLKTGIPYTTIIHLFKGGDTKVSTLIELAKYFEVPIDYLVFKNYQLITINNKGTCKKHRTTNIYEVLFENYCDDFAKMFK